MPEADVDSDATAALTTALSHRNRVKECALCCAKDDVAVAYVVAKNAVHSVIDAAQDNDPLCLQLLKKLVSWVQNVDNSWKREFGMTNPSNLLWLCRNHKYSLDERRISLYVDFGRVLFLSLDAAFDDAVSAANLRLTGTSNSDLSWLSKRAASFHLSTIPTYRDDIRQDVASTIKENILFAESASDPGDEEDY